MKLLVTVVFSILGFTSFCQDSISVLFIGNSYTNYNDLPGTFNSIAASRGDIVTYDSHTPGGTTFEGHTNNATTWTKINSQPWDYVVIQGQSQEPSFPDAQVDANSYPYAKELADSVYSNNFCSQVMFYMTWGRENGDSQWAPISTYDGMQERLRNAYLRFADSVKGSVSPVGVAWKYVRDNYPTIDLYNADESHPSPEGTYLAACTFYASTFRKSPVGASTFTGTIDPTVAAQLQYAAEVAVLDSLDTWFIRENQTTSSFDYVQNGTVVDFESTSWHATSWEWDFGNANSSNLENPSFDFGATGAHPTELIASSVCNSDTSTRVVDYVLGLDKNNMDYELKTLGEGKFDLVYASKAITILNSSGQIVSVIPSKNNSFRIDLSENPKGVYFIKSEELTLKVVR